MDFVDEPSIKNKKTTADFVDLVEVLAFSIALFASSGV